MTYFGVLASFILPPLLFLAVLELFQYRKSGGPGERRAYGIILAHVVLALVYTTPWDNYLVATGVWWYNPALVSGLRLGYVPIEEYIFFVMQTLLTGLWYLFISRRMPAAVTKESPRTRLAWSLAVAGVWAASSFMLLSGWKPGAYLGLILSWALIPVLVQVVFGADILRSDRRAVVIGITVPTVYLWLVDALAISSGTWTIDPAQTTGWMFGPLPVEEMLFFLMTNVIINLGMSLMLSPWSQRRLDGWISRRQKPGRPVRGGDAPLAGVSGEGS